MNPDQVKARRAAIWIEAHCVPFDMGLAMAYLVELAPPSYLNRPIESILRWAYTQVLQEKHHAR